jgi:hypothetical protein
MSPGGCAIRAFTVAPLPTHFADMEIRSYIFLDGRALHAKWRQVGAAVHQALPKTIEKADSMPHPIQNRYCGQCGLALPMPDTPCQRCADAAFAASQQWLPQQRAMFSDADERNHAPATEPLAAKPGYPYNTNPTRPLPRVRYEASREELLESMGHSAAFKNGPEAGGNLTDKAQGIELDEWTPQTGQNAARRMLERLDPGEPVFLIRGNDISASLFVRQWADLQALNPNPPVRKIAMARRIGLAMERWPNKKWPD